MVQKYKVLNDQSSGLEAGTIVEMFYGPTYGIDGQDSLVTGKFHVAVVEEDTAGPFFTCVFDDLLKIV